MTNLIVTFRNFAKRRLKTDEFQSEIIRRPTPVGFTDFIVMRKWKRLLVNSCVWKSPISVGTEFSNLCQVETYTTVCSGVMVKNSNTSLESVSTLIACHLIVMTLGTLLAEHFLKKRWNRRFPGRVIGSEPRFCAFIWKKLGNMTIRLIKVYFYRSECWKSCFETRSESLHIPWTVSAALHPDTYSEQMSQCI
jgi:hypothetical protein